MCILLLSLSRSFCPCLFFRTYAFIVCVHRSFHSWQVFLILFKPIGTMAHYSVYVVNRYRGSIDILDSLSYANMETSRSSFHGDCQNIVSVSYPEPPFTFSCLTRSLLCLVLTKYVDVSVLVILLELTII